MQKAKSLSILFLVGFYGIVSWQVVLGKVAKVAKENAHINAAQKSVTVHLSINRCSKSWKVTQEQEWEDTIGGLAQKPEASFAKIRVDSLYNTPFCLAFPQNKPTAAGINQNARFYNLARKKFEKTVFNSRNLQPNEAVSKRLACNAFFRGQSLLKFSDLSNLSEPKRPNFDSKLSFVEKIKRCAAFKIGATIGKKINCRPFLAPNYIHSGNGPLQTSGMAIASLVMGILGWLLFVVPIFPLICFVLAIVFGGIGLGETSDGKKSGRGLAIAGLVLGILGLLLGLLILALFLSILAMFP
jgi:hypothetical protein